MDYHSNVPWAITQFVNVLIFICLSKAKILVTIGPTIAEIFSGIFRILLSHPKSYNFSSRYLLDYWTDRDHICTEKYCHLFSPLGKLADRAI